MGERVIKVVDVVNDIRKILWLVVLVILIFGLLCATYSYTNQKKDMVSDHASIESIIEQNTDSIKNGNSNNTYYNLPEGAYNSYARCVVEFEYSDDYDYSKGLKQARYSPELGAFLTSDKILESVIEDLELREKYADMQNLSSFELSRMITYLLCGDNTFIFAVTDVDSQRAQLISQALMEKFVDQLPEYYNIKDIKVIDKGSLPKQMKICENAISKKKIVLFAFIGFLLGLIFMVCVCILRVIVRYTVRYESDVEQAGLKVLGVISERKKNYNESIKKVAVDLDFLNKKNIVVASIDNGFECTEITLKIKNALNDMNKDVVAIVDSEVPREAEDKKTIIFDNNIIEYKNLLDKYKDSDYIIKSSSNICENSGAKFSLRYADLVVILAQYDKTKVEQLNKLSKEVAIDKEKTYVLIV